MTQSSTQNQPYNSAPLPPDHYRILGVAPTASLQEIRQAYRERSKLYHPDTTNLPAAIATVKFQELNSAYATLIDPQQRAAYNQARLTTRYMPPSSPQAERRSSAYLDPVDRPLSGGELFALFILALTFIGCLLLAFAVGLTRGEVTLQTPVPAVQGLPIPSPSSPDVFPDRPSALTSEDGFQQAIAPQLPPQVEHPLAPPLQSTVGNPS